MRRVVRVAMLRGRPACRVVLLDRADEGFMWTEIERIEQSCEAIVERLPGKLIGELAHERLTFMRRKGMTDDEERVLSGCGFVTSSFFGEPMLRTPVTNMGYKDAVADLTGLLTGQGATT